MGVVLEGFENFLHDEPALRASFGERALNDLVRDIERAKLSRVVLVGGRSMQRTGSSLELVRDALGDRLATVCSTARPHSPVPMVIETARALREFDADGVVALGGGSAIVTARAASIVFAEGEDIAALATSVTADGKISSPRLMAPKLPQFVIPTTPTTAIVKAGSAVYDDVERRRRALFDPKTRARAVYVHPKLLEEVPVSVFVSAGLNTLCMAVEGLVATKGDPLADAQLSHALRLSADALVQLGGNHEAAAKTKLLVAAILCGRGTDSTNGGLTTALGHAIGVRHHVENGIVNAIALPHVLTFNTDFTSSSIAKVGFALGLNSGDQGRTAAVATRLRDLFDAVSVPKSLGAVGVTEGEAQQLAQHTFEDWFVRGNPRPVSGAAEIEQLIGDLI